MQKSHLSDASPMHAPTTVLLVEDNPISCKVQAKMLESKGFHVLHVDNGYDAIQAVKNSLFDAIIMDLNMPILNGYETTELIREWEKQQELQNVPIIALTASSTPKQEEYLSKGINYYIEKPLNEESIMHIFDLIDKSLDFPQ